VNDLQPANTKFLAISIPNAPAPVKNILAADYLATASTPIAPMYLDHLSFTASSLMFISFFDSVLIYSPSSSVPTSTSPKSILPSLIPILLLLPTCLLLFYFCCCCLSSYSLGLSKLLSKVSNSFTACYSISLYLVVDVLNLAAHDEL
jgi:hypothetical protein